MEQAPHGVSFFSTKKIQRGCEGACNLELNSENPDSCQLLSFLNGQESWSLASDKMLLEYLAEYSNRLISITSALNEKLDRLDSSVKSSLDRAQNIACRLDQLFFIPLAESNSISEITKDIESGITQNVTSRQDKVHSIQKNDHTTEDSLFSIGTEFTNKYLQAFGLFTSKDSLHSSSVPESLATDFQMDFGYLENLPPLPSVIDPDEYSDLSETNITTAETISQVLEQDLMTEQRPQADLENSAQAQEAIEPREIIACIDLNPSLQEIPADSDKNKIIQKKISSSASTPEVIPSVYDSAEGAIDLASHQSSKAFYIRRLSKIIQHKLQVYLDSKDHVNHIREINNNDVPANSTSEIQPLSDSEPNIPFPFLGDTQSNRDLLKKKKDLPELSIHLQSSNTEQLNEKADICSKITHSNPVNSSSRLTNPFHSPKDSNTKLSEFKKHQNDLNFEKDEKFEYEKTSSTDIIGSQFYDIIDKNSDHNLKHDEQNNDKLQLSEAWYDEDDDVFDRKANSAPKIKAQDKLTKIFENSISPEYNNASLLGTESTSQEFITEKPIFEVSEINIRSSNDKSPVFSTNSVLQDSIENRAALKTSRDSSLFDDDNDIFSNIDSTESVNQGSMLKTSPNRGIFSDDEDNVF